MSEDPEAPIDSGIHSAAMADEPGFDDADTSNEESGEDGPEAEDPTTGPGGQIAPREESAVDRTEAGLPGAEEKGDPGASFNR